MIINQLESETNYSEFINPIRNPERRLVASKFRIGNHNVKVETGNQVEHLNKIGVAAAMMGEDVDEAVKSGSCEIV